MAFYLPALFDACVLVDAMHAIILLVGAGVLLDTVTPTQKPCQLTGKRNIFSAPLTLEFDYYGLAKDFINETLVRDESHQCISIGELLSQSPPQI